jgi:hypothetical protein
MRETRNAPRILVRKPSENGKLEDKKEMGG